jgi:aspartate aminotransferase
MAPVTARSPVSPTLAMNEEIARRQAAGLPTLPLGFGEAGLPVLPELAEQLSRAAGLNGYGPVAGVPGLRRAVAGYFDRRGLPTDPDLVVAGPGSKPLLFALLQAVGELQRDGGGSGGDVGAGGDAVTTVALPSPCWVSYATQASLLGVRTQSIPNAPGSGGVPDPVLLDAAADRARAAGRPIGAVIVTLPDNPTGTLASPEIIRAFCAVVARHDLLVISDEIYRDLVHDETTPILSPAALLGDRTVVTTGLSKNLAVGGWRLGVARFGDSTIGRRWRDQVLSTASEIWSAPAHPVQLAAAWAFTEPTEVRARIAASRRLHGAVARAVSAVLTDAGIRHSEPQGGFYLYPELDDHRARLADRWAVHTGPDLARVLLDDLGVATLPASAFGQPDEVLAVRLATSQLYGSDDAQRLTALGHPRPAELPWIAAELDTLRAALAALLGTARGPGGWKGSPSGPLEHQLD